MNYTFTKLAQITQGVVLQMHTDTEMKRLLLDSRKITDVNHALFFAVKGKRHDGHQYIGELYGKGIRNFVVTEMPNLKNFPEGNFLMVKHSVKALQALAAFHRKQFQIPVIGITGSNGKTITKERSEEHTSELQSRENLVCRLL